MATDPTLAVSYLCPRCRLPVELTADAYRCAPCAASYPVICGIPDFRVFADPYINLEEDREKAQRLFERSRGLSFVELVEEYFRITPEVPPALAAQYRHWMLSGAGALRGTELLDAAQTAGAPGLAGRVLEIGCGSGPFLNALGARFQKVVLTDIALRWLVIARLRAQELGLDAEFVACCAEHLPFAPNRFEVVVGASILEHAKSPELLLAEVLRVLDKDGLALFSTPNRWSVGPDPHLGVWGFGWLPERWTGRAAGLLRGLPFDKVRTRGYLDWNRVLLEAGFRRVQFLLPDVPPQALPPKWRAAGQLYRRVKATTLGEAALLLVGPAFVIVAFKGPNRS